MLYKRHILLELCVDSVSGAEIAQRAGAERIELCENLYQGGVTPSAGKIRQAKMRLSIPVFVLIRPRKGDFLYTEAEFATIIEDIHIARELGADGIVSGALTPDGVPDLVRIRQMVDAAGALPFTHHRAFDMCRDPLYAIDALADCGVKRILTSGQQSDAVRGLQNISRFLEHAEHKIGILACGGLLAENVSPLLDLPLLKECHAATRHEVHSVMQYRGAVNMGDEDATEEFRWHETSYEMALALYNSLNPLDNMA
jgi:copper homeostasis protein